MLSGRNNDGVLMPDTETKLKALIMTETESALILPLSKKQQQPRIDFVILYN